MFASAGFHLLLVIILFVGPAFLSSNSKPNPLPLIDFVPVVTVDALISGGGNPKAPPTAAASAPAAPPRPTPPTPEPTPVKPVAEPVTIPKPKPEPVKPEPVKPEPKPDETLSLNPSPKPKPKTRKIEVSTDIVRRDPKDAKAQARAAAEADAKRAAEAQRKLADLVGRRIDGIRGGLAGSTSIEFRGPGGGGEPYAGFDQAVLSFYDRAWISPENMSGDEAVVGVRVVINRDGSVESARIIQPSGDAAVDRSVRQALDRVRNLPPFPEGSTQKQRTIEFNFRPRAKISLG